ncbi:MAG: hypothetical protein JWM79_4006 [Nocardioides sp.]|nr:hypothetical protein [Nocardioides sp.]
MYRTDIPLSPGDEREYRIFNLSGPLLEASHG